MAPSLKLNTLKFFKKINNYEDNNGILFETQLFKILLKLLIIMMIIMASS